LVSPSEAHRHDGTLNQAETKVALFTTAVIEVFGDHTQRVEKCQLRKLEPDAMLCPIAPFLGGILLEIGHKPRPLVCMYNVPYLCMAEKPADSDNDAKTLAAGYWRQDLPIGATGRQTPLREALTEASMAQRGNPQWQ
jgi:hypothetical protein